MKDIKQQALDYHCQANKPGKLEVIPSKPCSSADELSLAYTPGVAEPVMEIDSHPETAYRYTNRGNLVAVISNGSAILGLGNRGALASKPVMEGKGVLFKRFADIDVYDIELNCSDPDKLIAAVEMMEPTFGGINLEDIKAPECFYIEEELKKRCSIPVFHDDQHGTAIIATAGLLNGLEIAGKSVEEAQVVINGAGAAGISCARMFLNAGIKKEHLLLCDKHGIIHENYPGASAQQLEFASCRPERSLADAMKGADLFMGVSVANCVSPEMLKSMAHTPLVFAMANPKPEIDYKLATDSREDLIMATGRSDYPNQINNVLGFPFIFRAALDVHAKTISEGMKMAAARALAELAKEPVPDSVKKAYGNRDFQFGRHYIVPKPFDPRVIEYETVAVARQACREGLAENPIEDWEGYKRSLRKRMEKYWG